VAASIEGCKTSFPLEERERQGAVMVGKSEAFRVRKTRTKGIEMVSRSKELLISQTFAECRMIT
jgi:hypothetical protein